MNAVELRGVAKRFGPTTVVADVDLDVAEGSITAILGASGSGKTTLLRIIAGFERVDAGRVTLDGRVVDDGQTWVRTQDRRVGYVPQDGALFPHLNVAANVGFGVARRDRARVAELIELVGLGGLEQRAPHQLSGGQQQRVALARALAVRPRVVLLDEPFSSLDESMRAEVRRDVARVLTETGSTAVLVTHDQDEALTMADQIAILRGGHFVASADPRDLYRNPDDLVAAEAIGEANVLPATIERGHARCALGIVALAAPAVADGAGQLLLRPEQIVVHLTEQPGTRAGTVVEVQYHGHDALAAITIDPADAKPLLARVTGDLAIAPGRSVWVSVTGTARAWSAPPLDRTPR